MWRDDQKSDLFKTAKRMIKTNKNINSVQWMRNDDGAMEVSNEHKKSA